ncbi:Enhancer of polycomb-like protein [Caenorhabditis elegans]|uniref:Enhancer of polycomb-like protein n=1 Tax=Caenorhabditis elegans TaxID=6239 RepID=Q19410_CAEEL|nr:Enhancer of polycomb-like protein [Caenorhabditis elegans]CAA93408.2 Enhancer of polycomb-like protein [Caenorhabditis elegans]|eukprot:NP_502020.2 Uncharacterized protein CELE_F13E9.5 [Caenorhabditis elegans]
MADAKEEKRQAKLQDKNFVDYRKQEILHDIKPKTKAFNLKKFDDAFPKPNKKKEANMEFGELMHKYLTMRPDGRFATWHGKPQTKKTRKTKLDPNDGKTGLLQKMTSAAGVNKQAKDLPVTNRKATKNYTRAVKNAINQKADFEEDEVDQKRLSEALKFLPKEEVEAKNRYALNAIVDNKPFWLVGDPVVPEDEEEAYVDAEMLSNYTSNPEGSQYIYNETERKEFFPWGPTPQLWNETKHFQNKMLVIGNTLRSIIESTAERKGIPKERVDKGHKPILKWSQKTKIVDYAMESVPLEKTAIYEGKLQNILKENAKKD